MVLNQKARTHRVLFFSLLVINTTVFGSKLITGDDAAPDGQTFSFPISTHVRSKKGNSFYVGARTAGGNEFSIAGVAGDTTQIFPRTPESVMLNNVTEQTNPLFNQGIQLLALMEPREKPVAVTTADVASVHVSDGNKVFSLTNIKDASGTNTTSEIIALTGAGESCAFAAVQGNGQVGFGTGGSGIALLVLTSMKVTQEDGTQKTQQELVQLDYDPNNPVMGAVRAAPLNTTSSFVKITNDLASISDVVDMHWDGELQRLYITLQITGGAGAGDGGYALLVGEVTKSSGQITLRSAIPATTLVAGNNNEIVGAIGANAQVSLQKVRTMKTSTKLHYAIVQGGNGAPGATNRTVFALPLVCNPTEAAQQGTIADKTVDPTEDFTSLGFFAGRRFATAATTNAGMTLSTDVPAQVGGGALAAGDIDDIFVVNDTVFAVVSTAAANQKPGIFFSQAIFDENGVIKNWTQWQRTGGTTARIFGASQDANNTNITFMTGADANNVFTVKQTQWNDGDTAGLADLTDVIRDALPQDNGGAQCLFDFKQSNAALSDVALMVATGNKKVVLAETGSIQAGTLCPHTGDFATGQQDFQNGAVTTTFAGGATPRVITIAGGVLDECGALTQAELGQEGTNGFLFIGGSGGLAVLTRPNGDGWNSATGLAAGFFGLTDDMTFKKVGEYTFVKKLIHDGGFLYVLTANTFDRIDLAASNFATGVVSATTLATPSDFEMFNANASFADCIVSEKLALLGTSNMLFRVGNGNNIRTAANFDAVEWQAVTIPEGLLPIVSMNVVSNTGNIVDAALNNGGNIYVIDGNIGKNRARVHRFCIADLSASQITDTTVQHIPDIRKQNIPTFFGNFGVFTPTMQTEGTGVMYALEQNLTTAPCVKNVTEFPRDATSLAVPLTDASCITRIVRSNISGSNIVAGDFGLQINE